MIMEQDTCFECKRSVPVLAVRAGKNEVNLCSDCIEDKECTHCMGISIYSTKWVPALGESLCDRCIRDFLIWPPEPVLERQCAACHITKRTEILQLLGGVPVCSACWEGLRKSSPFRHPPALTTSH